MLDIIFDILDEIISHKGGFVESWGNLTINVGYYNELQTDIQKLSNELTNYHYLLAPKINVETDSIDIEEIDDYSGSDFIIIINKLNLKRIDDYDIQFFYSIDYFEDWIKSINPLKVTSYCKLKIIVYNLDTITGGPNLLITNNINESFDNNITLLPSNEIVAEHVVIPNNSNLCSNVNEYLTTFVEKRNPKNKYYSYCLRNSAITLCSTFVNELNEQSVILQGVKRVKLALCNEETQLSLKFLLLLKEIIEWIYLDGDSAKIDIKRKLFLDRVTLDIDHEQPLLNELPIVANNAFEQAKERYNFVMLERRDAYAKELTNLLKDLKAQSDLYSSKVRSLLGNLTRDVLAGILLIGFTMFTKFTEIEKLSRYENIINIIFCGLAIYFTASAITQAIIDTSDLILSRVELNHWCKCTSEVIPKKELKNHIRKTLNPRIIVTIIIYILLMILYALIIFATWNFPSIWNEIFK